MFPFPVCKALLIGDWYENRRGAPTCSVRLFLNFLTLVVWACSTLNLSLLNLEHVIFKQLQLNLKYAFKFVFLFHVLILNAEKQLFPRCKPLLVIWIQGIVNSNFFYICSCYTYLCCAPPLLPPSPSSVNIAAILLLQCEEDGSAV